MRVTVCELSNDLQPGEWDDLVAHVRSEASDLVLLPEMPFYRWLPGTRAVDPSEWERSVQTHERWMARLAELGAKTIVTTQPVANGEGRFNQVVVHDGNSPRPAHRKHYLPDEEGFWEASWYSRGTDEFATVEAQGARLGFLVCTEQWFLRHARDYGNHGVQIIACPRATLAPSVEKWLAGGRTAAVVSGAFCLSSNFSGKSGSEGEWGGTGWIIEPEEGEILGTTSQAHPFLTLDIDLGVADAAKSTYPRYVVE